MRHSTRSPYSWAIVSKAVVCWIFNHTVNVTWCPLQLNSSIRLVVPHKGCFDCSSCAISPCFTWWCFMVSGFRPQVRRQRGAIFSSKRGEPSHLLQLSDYANIKDLINSHLSFILLSINLSNNKFYCNTTLGCAISTISSRNSHCIDSFDGCGILCIVVCIVVVSSV